VPSAVNPVSAIGLSLIIAFVPHFIKAGVVGSSVGYNNVEPRQAVERMTHLQTKGKCSDGQVAMVRRCKAAHENGLEAFTFFAVAVVAAIATGVQDKAALSSLCTLFLASRFCYNLVYVFGSNEALAGLRSLCWFLGNGCVASLLMAAAAAYEVSP
jgi:uncharacterized MAPEG superfamily protein